MGTTLDHRRRLQGPTTWVVVRVPSLRLGDPSPRPRQQGHQRASGCHGGQAWMPQGMPDHRTALACGGRQTPQGTGALRVQQP
jgi:hypothetical protein